MKTLPWFILAIQLPSLLLSGCSGEKSPTVAEGVVLSVVYQDADGKSVGFTRMNDSRAVDAQSGSWNIDAYARVTRDFLIITRPQRKDMGPLVIPSSRLVSIQFGDGGIQHVDEGKPK